MSIMHSLGDFAAHLLTMEADIKLAEEVAVVKACKKVSNKNLIDHENQFWPALKPETIARNAHGNTPVEDDRRRLCRERKVLIAERVRHVNRIKGPLFAQGVSEYEPLRRDRRECLAGLVTGDGRVLPNYLKANNPEVYRPFLAHIAIRIRADALGLPAATTPWHGASNKRA
jgi:hypothetical protein